jgi:predicted GNAT family N-acyltransferase
MGYQTELLDGTHIKNEFDCGQELLNAYVHKQASQDVKRHLSACFVIADEAHKITGYYTLSNVSIDRELVPEELKKKLPKSYHDLPVTLLGRLARDKKSKGERLGETLLLDALKRCYDTSLKVGSIAVIVDPIDENAKEFYLKYGFISLPDSGKMFLTMKTISSLF